MRKCENADCRARSTKFENGCKALGEIEFLDSQGLPRACPFFKTKEQWLREVIYLKNNGHAVD